MVEQKLAFCVASLTKLTVNIRDDCLLCILTTMIDQLSAGASSDPAKVLSITITPDPPKKSMDLTLTAEFTLGKTTKTIVGDNFNMTYPCRPYPAFQ